jgi:hypothetical protein
MTTKAPNPGALIDKLAKARAAKTANAVITKQLEADYKAIETEVMETLEAQGITGAKGKLGTVSIIEAIVPDVQDWDKFYAMIKKNGWFHLLNRAPNAPAFREALELKGEAWMEKNGVTPFHKKTLSLTAAK